MKGESISCQKGYVTVMKWKDKCNVLMISTTNGPEMQDISKQGYKEAFYGGYLQLEKVWIRLKGPEVVVLLYSQKVTVVISIFYLFSRDACLEQHAFPPLQN